MVAIEFTISEDDIVALSEYRAQTSPYLARQRRELSYHAPFWVAALGLLAAFFLHSWIPLAVGVAAGAVWAISLPAFLTRTRRESVRRILAEGENRALFGKSIAEVTPDGLRLETDGSTAQVAWSAIERVEETDSHCFIFTSAVSALVIPKEAVVSGDLGVFIRELSSHRSAAV